MDDSKKAPAILLFKNMKSAISRLTDADRLSLFDAILQYADDDTVPEMNYAVGITFEFIKRSIDTNEEKYQKRLEYQQAKYKERKKTKNKQDKENSSNGIEGEQNKKATKSKEKTLTKEQENFLKSFKEHCPNKKIDCEITDYPNIDLNKLMLEIKRSPQFLMENDNYITLKWCLEHCEKIINGAYRKTGDTPKSNFSTGRHYSSEEYNSLFQNPDEIEV